MREYCGWYVVGCGRGFSGCVSVKVMYLGYFDGIFLRQEVGVSSGWDVEVSWGGF